MSDTLDELRQVGTELERAALVGSKTGRPDYIRMVTAEELLRWHRAYAALLAQGQVPLTLERVQQIISDWWNDGSDGSRTTWRFDDLAVAIVAAQGQAPRPLTANDIGSMYQALETILVRFAQRQGDLVTICAAGIWPRC